MTIKPNLCEKSPWLHNQAVVIDVNSSLFVTFQFIAINSIHQYIAKEKLSFSLFLKCVLLLATKFYQFYFICTLCEE